MPELVNLAPSETPWRAEVDSLLWNSWPTIQQGEIQGEGAEQTARVTIRLKRTLEFSIIVMTIAFGVFMTFIFGYQQPAIGHAHSPKLIISSVLTFSTFLSGLILMFLTIKLLRLNHPETRRKHYMAAKVLTHVSIVLLILTSLNLVDLLPKKYAILAFILLLIIVTVGLLIYYHGLQLDQAASITDYESQKAQIKRSTNLSSSVTTLSFGGMVGSISYYTKNVSDLAARKPHINVGFFIIFFTSLSGLFSIFLIALVLPSLDNPVTRQRLVTFNKFFSFFLLMLQALTAIAFSHEFLGKLVLPAFCPTILGAMVWFAMEFSLTEPIDHGHCVTSLEGIELKPISKFSTTVTSITFGGITTIFTGYIGSMADTPHLESCVFLMLAAYISGLSLRLLTFGPPKTRSSIMVRILTCFSFWLLALAALDVILLVA